MFNFRLTEKPHSLKPLSILVEYDNEGNECYSHPYAYEIDNFRMPEWQMEKRDKTEPKLSALSLTDTPCIMVNTLEGLNSMVAELSKFKEIGVDLEAHSYRTYLGLTCLIQVIFCFKHLHTAKLPRRLVQILNNYSSLELNKCILSVPATSGLIPGPLWGVSVLVSSFSKIPLGLTSTDRGAWQGRILYGRQAFLMCVFRSKL